MKKSKKAVSLILALALVMSLGISAFADGGEITEAGGSSSIPVTLTCQAAQFSATVPTAFPLSVDSYGEISYASNLKIVNNTNAQIKVASASVEGSNGWTLNDFTDDYTVIKTNAKKFGFRLQGKNVPVSGTCDVSGFGIIDGGDELAVTYEAALTNQSAAVSGAEIAKVVITLAWNT